MKNLSLFCVVLALFFLTPSLNFAQCADFSVTGVAGTYVGGFMTGCNQPAKYIQPYNISCFGANDGTINIQINGGKAPYTIAWSNGSDNESLKDLGPGEYKVVVTDANNCVATWSAILTQPDPLEASIQISDNPVAKKEGNCVVLDASTVVGGTSYYLFEWSDGERLPVRLFCAEPGEEISVLVKDVNGCSQNVSAQMPITNDIVSSNVLFKAFPNPFSDATKIQFRLNEDSEVNLELYSIDGKSVSRIWSGEAKSDELKEIDFSGKNLSQGVYEIRLNTAAGATHRMKLMVVR